MTRTKELQKLWWDWLSTSERLLRMLGDQTRALVRRDVATIEAMQPDLDTMLARMRSIDESAVASARKLAEALGAEPNLRGLVGALPQAEAQQVQGLANRVAAAARTVDETIVRNRALIQNELEYIHGTAAIITKVATESQGKYAPKTKGAVLVDQAA
ncbi:MAG: flagellar export chaperone FlgN [Armatimonadetes bacterium]|nr:flagellar export chaperone FlgN [Armatimonadota bacterium]